MNIALLSLWLPILLSAVAIFVASSLVWMVLQYHNSDWKKLPDEEAARADGYGSNRPLAVIRESRLIWRCWLSWHQ